MLKTKSLNRVTMSVTVLMLVATLLLWGRVEAVQGNGSHTMGYEDLLFDQSYVHTIDITMDNWDELIDTATTETYMECSITIDGEKYLYFVLLIMFHAVCRYQSRLPWRRWVRRAIPSRWSSTTM